MRRAADADDDAGAWRKNFSESILWSSGPGIKTGMPILYENPKDVGADRIVNGIAAYEKYHDACIIVDFGTATTIDLISKKGEYIGGAIAPGLSISLEALVQRASKLPRIEVIKPKEVVGRNTINSIQAGIFYGYVGLVDGIVRRIQDQHDVPFQGRRHRRLGALWWRRNVRASMRWMNF